MYDLVDVVAGDDESLEYVGPLFGFPFFELGASDYDVVPMVDKAFDDVFEVEDFWAWASSCRTFCEATRDI